MGATLPLVSLTLYTHIDGIHTDRASRHQAGPALYATLGANWAGTLLGLIEAVCIPIPFIFYRYGHKIRERSTLIRTMRDDQMRREAKQKKAQDRITKRAEAEADAGAAMGTGAAVAEEKDIEKAEM